MRRVICTRAFFPSTTCEMINNPLLSVAFEQQPPGIFVHPSGVEQSFRECISALKGNHGDQKEKQYRVWVDQVFPTKIGSDTWLVKFQKWEMHGETLFLSPFLFE